MVFTLVSQTSLPRDGFYFPAVCCRMICRMIYWSSTGGLEGFCGCLTEVGAGCRSLTVGSRLASVVLAWTNAASEPLRALASVRGSSR